MNTFLKTVFVTLTTMTMAVPVALARMQHERGGERGGGGSAFGGLGNNGNGSGNGFGNIRKHGGGNGGAFQNFPKYPVAPKRGGGERGGGEPSAIHRVPARPDSLGNRITDDHLNRVEFAHGRTENVMRNDPHVTNIVRLGRAHFTNVYRPEFEHKTVIINDWVRKYNTIVIQRPVYVDVWRRHAFFGGFYWGFHPIVDIDVYFYNPMVYWFYVGTFDEPYYRNWYSAQYDAYPELHRPFEYHGLYYPTENLRQLLFGVSAMSVEKQARFRASVSNFTQKLAQKMANGLGRHVTLQNGDIAVTHYEIIGYDDAVVLEGVVTFQGNAYNFKGLVDLESPSQTMAFVPATWDKNPTPEQLENLDAINSRIGVIKGEPVSESIQAEPDAPAPTPGSVSADPEGR